jgi:PAS domain S-box-containing protein
LKDPDQIRSSVVEVAPAAAARSAHKPVGDSRIWLPIAGAFLLLCIFNWANEIFDIPHWLLGARPSPINWQEAAIETVMIVLVGFFCVSRLVLSARARKRAENDLVESEQRLTEIINFLPDATFAIDMQGRVIAWNRAMEEMTGVKAPDMLGRGDYEYALPFYGIRRLMVIDLVFKSDEEIKQQYAFVQKVEDALIAEAKIQTSDGKTIYLWGKAGPIYDKSGNLIGAIESVRDMTEHRLAEEMIRKSEEQYRMLVDTMSDGLIVRDKNGRISFVNDRLCRLWGASKDEIINQRMEDFLDEANRAAFDEEMEKRRKGIYAPYEIAWTRKDGRKVTTIMAPRIIVDARGEFAGSFSVVTDITDRKRAEGALARQALELARSNSELEQFAYVASHDLQEPLRKIQAFGERLNAKCADAISDQGLDYLKRMQNAAKRMQVLINDLLSFSRVTTRASSFTPLNLKRVVREVLLDMDFRIEQTRGRVEVGDLPVIEGDPTQMLQLFLNLIGNALKFQREGVAPVVKIRSEIYRDNRKKGGAFCRIFVEDNGIGFDEAYAERIFGVFQRLHGRGVYEGTGIGLAVCRKIVERHGGSIQANSTPDQGSVFTITLPFNEAVKEKPVLEQNP